MNIPQEETSTAKILEAGITDLTIIVITATITITEITGPEIVTEIIHRVVAEVTEMQAAAEILEPIITTTEILKRDFSLNKTKYCRQVFSAGFFIPHFSKKFETDK